MLNEIHCLSVATIYPYTILRRVLCSSVLNLPFLESRRKVFTAALTPSIFSGRWEITGSESRDLRVNLISRYASLKLAKKDQESFRSQNNSALLQSSQCQARMEYHNFLGYAYHVLPRVPTLPNFLRSCFLL
jgi:hypothetical protein